MKTSKKFSLHEIKILTKKLIDYILEKKGMTQSQLASFIGISPDYISKLKNGSLISKIRDKKKNEKALLKLYKKYLIKIAQKFNFDIPQDLYDIYSITEVKLRLLGFTYNSNIKRLERFHLIRSSDNQFYLKRELTKTIYSESHSSYKAKSKSFNDNFLILHMKKGEIQIFFENHFNISKKDILLGIINVVQNRNVSSRRIVFIRDINRFSKRLIIAIENYLKDEKIQREISSLKVREVSSFIDKVDKWTNGRKNYFINLPTELTTIFQQYLSFFPDFIRKTTGFNINFEVKKDEQGLYVNFDSFGQLEVKDIEVYLNDYLLFQNNSADDLKIKSTKYQKLDELEIKLLKEEIKHQITGLRNGLILADKRIALIESEFSEHRKLIAKALREGNLLTTNQDQKLSKTILEENIITKYKNKSNLSSKKVSLRIKRKCEEVKKFIKTNQMENAFEAAHELQSSILDKNDLLLLQSNWNELIRRELISIDNSESIQIAKNKIKNALLRIISIILKEDGDKTRI